MKRMASRRAVVAWLAVLVAVAPLLFTAGTTGAPVPGASTDADDRTAQQAARTVTLDSGDRVWQGWRLRFDGSEVVGDPSSASAAERTFQLREVSEDGVVGDLVREFTIGTDGTHQLRTGELDGRYVIQYRGSPVYVQDGVGYRSNPPDGTSVTAENSAWRVNRQTLTATWSDQPAYEGQIIELSVSSNRKDYALAVSAPGLNFSELTRLFDESDFADDHDAAADEDVIRLAVDGAPYPVNLTGLDSGDQLFRLEATDTTAKASPTLEIAPPDGPQFGATDRVSPTGDRLRVDVNCGTCYLIVGSQALNFLDVVQLTDTDGDGTVDVRINTRYLGLSQSSSDVPGGAAFTAVDDEIEVYGPGEELDSGYTLQRVRNEVEPKVSEDPPAPLGPGAYDLRLASTDSISIPHNRLAFDDVTDISSVRLVERELRAMSAVAAPRGEPHELAVGEVQSVQPRDRVAVGDRLILRADVTGVFGYLAVEGAGVDSVLDNADEGIALTLHPANDRSTKIRVERGDPRLIVDEDDRRLYVAVDTRDLRIEEEFRPGRAYRAVLTLQGVDADAYNVNQGPNSHDGYPYLEPGAEETVRARFTLVRPAATTAQPLEVTNRQSVVVAGNTTVAPGTTLRLTATEADSGWEKTARTTVADGGTWQTRMDFSNAQAGQTFTLTIERGQEELGTVEGAVVTSTPTPTDSGTTDTSSATTTAPPGSPSTTVPPTTAPSEPDPGATTTAPDDDGLLGFLPGGILLPIGGVVLVVVLGVFLYFGFRE